MTNEEETKEAEESEREILSELGRFGKKLGKAVQETWERDERKQIQKKMLTELKLAGEQIEKVAKGVGKTKPAKDIHEGAEKIGRSMGDGILKGLRALNKELTRVLDERAPDDNEDEDEDKE